MKRSAVAAAAAKAAAAAAPIGAISAWNLQYRKCRGCMVTSSGSSVTL